MKTVGILGGMGPLATADLYTKIILATAAAADGEHVPLLISSRPDIPDRAASIDGRGESALPALKAEAKRLEQAGAQGLCLGCNTAHYYFDDLQKAVSVPLLHMPRLTAAFCRERGIEKALLLAAPGTYRAGIYEQAFEGTGITLVRPEEKVQRLTAQCIYEGIKAGRRNFDPQELRKELGKISLPILLGCTELPIAFDWYRLQGDTIDPGAVLAKEVVRFAGGVCR